MSNRSKILAKARELSEGDEVQFIGYSEEETKQAELAASAIDKLRALRALWKREDAEVLSDSTLQ
jgi:hypothetical protein